MGSSTSGKKHKKEKKHKRHHSVSTSDEEEINFDLTRDESKSSGSHHRKHKKHKEHKHREHKHKRHHHHHEREREHRSYDYEHEKSRPEVVCVDVQESDSDSSDCVEVPVVSPAAHTASRKSPVRSVPPPPPVISKSSQRDLTEHASSSHRHARDDSHYERIEREDSRRHVREDVRHDDLRREVREDTRREVRDDSRREVRDDPRREVREDTRREARDDSRREVRDDFRRDDTRREVRDNQRRDVREDVRYSARRDDYEASTSRQRERPPTPPPPKVGRMTSPEPARSTKRRHEYSRGDANIYDDGPSTSKSRRMRTSPPPPERSPSPIPENGAGDVLSIEETNKLRAKLGLKPLEIDPQPSKPITTAASKGTKQPGLEKDLSKYKDEWGEFLHKPADNLKEKAQAEKIREKLKQHKEKRQLEDRLRKIRTLGESDDEVDDVSKWVERSKRVVDEKKEAEKRAKALEEMDAEFGVSDLVEEEKRESRRNAYNAGHLRGLRVEHDIENFTEGRTVILTLKDKDVLDEENDDALVNVNMIDDERYTKNVKNKKQNPLSYGYDVYEEQYDQFGNPIDRGILEKYDEDVDGKTIKKKDFVIGEDLEYQKEQKRKLLEIKTKLAGKRLETLDDINLQMARDTFSETELATFKKPKKKVRKLRQKLKADDLLPLTDEPIEQHLGHRAGRRHHQTDEDDEINQITETDSMDIDVKPDIKNIKIDEVDDDLDRILNKARKLKQKKNLIQKPLPIDVSTIKQEIKNENPETSSSTSTNSNEDHIVLNATAEFCRTLGDIPTYGMSGNRNVDENERMELDEDEEKDELTTGQTHYENDELTDAPHGTWNSVNPEEIMRPIDIEIGSGANGEGVEEVAILDEEPDVGAGVANALRLALSKGYLEKEERKRPSNTTMAHLQAKNYSIEDKSAGDDEKIGRRDRFHSGPISDFRDKDNFKPNVKLEYIDDNGRILNLKEAFRYLSHKFHGKGPGKNKIEKRLKKMEQDGLMKTMSSTDTPLGTLTMLQQKQKETKTPYVVLSGGKQTPSSTSISKYK